MSHRRRITTGGRRSLIQGGLVAVRFRFHFGFHFRFIFGSLSVHFRFTFGSIWRVYAVKVCTENVCVWQRCALENWAMAIVGSSENPRMEMLRDIRDIRHGSPRISWYSFTSLGIILGFLRDSSKGHENKSATILRIFVG